jgi:hypothetical protein
MRLVPITMDQWMAAQRWEAAERGYTFSFLTQSDRVVAQFFNREFYLYERVFDAEEARAARAHYRSKQTN